MPVAPFDPSLQSFTIEVLINNNNNKYFHVIYLIALQVSIAKPLPRLT